MNPTKNKQWSTKHCLFVLCLSPLFCLSFCSLPFTFVLFVFLYFAFHLCFVCLFVLCLSPLLCLSFCTLPFTFVLFVFLYFAKVKDKVQKDKQNKGEKQSTKRQAKQR
jgi:hypothetical protein